MTDAPQPPAAPQSDLTTRFAMGVAMIAVACLVTWFGGWPVRALWTAMVDFRWSRYLTLSACSTCEAGWQKHKAHAFIPTTVEAACS